MRGPESDPITPLPSSVRTPLSLTSLGLAGEGGSGPRTLLGAEGGGDGSPSLQTGFRDCSGGMCPTRARGKGGAAGAAGFCCPVLLVQDPEPGSAGTLSCLGDAALIEEAELRSLTVTAHGDRSLRSWALWVQREDVFQRSQSCGEG